MPKQNQMPIQRRIGLRIKELRANTPYSQEALAARSNLDRTYINSVETHK
jgi:transcriptional regulator with XRE-family HTH domain